MEKFNESTESEVLEKHPLDKKNYWILDAKAFDRPVSHYKKFANRLKRLGQSDKFYAPEANIKFTLSQKNAYGYVEKFLAEPLSYQLDNTQRISIQGQAGFGKSVLLRAIKNLICKYGQTALVCSPVGVSAALNDSQTIHSCLSIPFKHSGSWEQLDNEQVNAPYSLINKLNGVSWIIFDEFSQIGCHWFNYICRLLSKARNDTRPFGNLNCILVGEIFQLLPLFDAPLWSNPQSLDSFGAEGCNIYRSFKPTFFLNEPCRQVGDSRFVELLHRLRIKQLTEDDINLLRSRMEVNLSPNERIKFKDSFRIYPRNYHVHKYNRLRLLSLKLPILALPAQQKPEYPKVHRDEEDLLISKGCRIQLTRNISCQALLVSGALGIVESVLFGKTKHHSDLPACIFVKFDSLRCSTLERQTVPIFPITDYTVDSQTGKSVKLTYFPLRLAYSSSIHRAQGSTYTSIAVDLDNKEFFEQASFVSLSRCQSLSQLMILNKTLSNTRFKDKHFHRGEVRQKEEFKRLGVFESVFGVEKQIEQQMNIESDNEMSGRVVKSKNV